MAETRSLISTRLLIIVIAVSLVTGSVAGGLVGFVAGVSGEMYGESIVQSWQWFLGDGDRSLPESAATTVHTITSDAPIVSAVEQVSPSVVSVIVTKEIATTQFFNSPFSFPFDDFFDFPFEFETPEQAPSQRQQIGGGTGFVIDAEAGLILTNKHVVDDETAEYSIMTNDGEELQAEVLARDPFNDLAVVKVPDLHLPEVRLGDSDELQLGQQVIAIGNSLGEFRNTVTTGVVSGVGRDIVAGGAGLAERLDDVIQTDAAINPGNSGGPLININGEVIGINTAVSSQGQAIGFAIPVNAAKQVVESVKEYGRIVRPYIGVRYRMLSDALVQENSIGIENGALIVRGDQPSQLAVIPGGPADKAGLVENDIIINVQGESVNEDNSLSRLIQQYKPGDTITLTIWHDGEVKDIGITLEEYKQNEDL